MAVCPIFPNPIYYRNVADVRFIHCWIIRPLMVRFLACVFGGFGVFCAEFIQRAVDIFLSSRR